MTGFAWTTAVLGTLSYWSFLLCQNWLDQKPEIMALWMLPLVGLAAVGLEFERRGKVRWATPFDWISLAALIVCLDVMASYGPTLKMLGFTEERFPFFVSDRQSYLSVAANGYLFLALMMWTERSRSLDLRRASRMLEPIALLHMMGPLFANALEQRGHPDVGYDVTLYVGTVVLLLLIGPWRSSWRILVGALGGVAFGSYLLIDLEIVSKSPFTLGLGLAGILTSGVMALYLVRSGKTRDRVSATLT